jgi:hypothetical protein
LTVEQGKGAPPLRAPEAGIIALSARVFVLGQRIRERAPTVARLLDGAVHLSCAADRKAERVELEVELRYATAERAAEVAAPIAEVLGALERSGFRWLAGARVGAAGPSVSVRLTLESGEVERLLACWLGAGCVATRTAPSDVLPSAPE